MTDRQYYEDIEDRQFWADREADFVAAEEAAASIPQMYKELEAAKHDLRVMTGDRGRYSDDDRTAQYALVDRLQAVVDADSQRRFAADWPLETTQARRAEWNNIVNGDASNLPAARRHALNNGWDITNLKRAIEMHGI